jgi:lipid-A-disaccharide synthase
VAVKRVMMIAGEASGDMHAAGVVRELKRKVPAIEVFGMGGERMAQEGMDLTVHMSHMAFMGFAEVVRHLRTILRVQRALELQLDRRRPDVVLLVDYPGFNLRFAEVAHRHGIPVLYYISPQVWAWHRSRVKNMKRLVDKMHVIFPFEEPIYAAEGIPVEFVGHPLVERLAVQTTKEEFVQRHGLSCEKPLLALFPGSRTQEIERILPIMVRSAAMLHAATDLQVALGVASNLGCAAVAAYVPPSSGIRLIEHATYDLMHHADAAIVTSGTATLEAGWFGTPMVVVYKTSPLSYAIGRRLVDVQHIGLVNIVAGRSIVPELIQHECSPERLVAAMTPLLTNVAAASAMRSELSVIRERLGSGGASAKVAASILAWGAAA